MRAAQAAGKLDNLKGAGKPLKPGGTADDIGYRIMAEEGAVPEEIRLRKAVDAQLEQMKSITEADARKAAMARLADLQMQLAMAQEARRKFQAGP